MREDKKKELDKMLRRGRLPETRIIVWALILIGTLGFIGYLTLQVNPANLYGETVAVETILTNDGTAEIAIVKLDSGEQIKAPMPANLEFRLHARVQVYRHSSGGGMARYRFVRYQP
ncbi:MAG: hypothetical protein ACPG4N_07165 [Gammaproteobacteria bacterium]